MEETSRCGGTMVPGTPGYPGNCTWSPWWSNFDLGTMKNSDVGESSIFESHFPCCVGRFKIHVHRIQDIYLHHSLHSSFTMSSSSDTTTTNSKSAHSSTPTTKRSEKNVRVGVGVLVQNPKHPNQVYAGIRKGSHGELSGTQDTLNIISQGSPVSPQQWN